jgi:hypothetical protein
MQMSEPQAAGDIWEVKVLAYDDLTLTPNGAPDGNLKQVDIDKLLTTLALFADQAGKKLNDMDVCPSELTVAGNVALDLGGVLLFGVSAGISVSMTWTFTAVSPGRPGRTH